MEVTGLFSEGADILKKNPLVAVPLVAVGIIVGVLTLVLVGSMVAGAGMMGLGAMKPGVAFGAVMGAALLVGIISGVLNLIAMGMTYAMADEAAAGKADLNSGLNKTLANIVNLVVTAILVGIIVLIGMMLLFLPGLIAAYLLMFSIVLVMLENKGPVEALKGSFDLVKSHIGETIVFAVIAIVVMFIAGIIGGILGVIPVIGTVIISPIITGTATAYVSIVLVLLYKELKK